MNRTSLINSTLGEYRVLEFLGAGGMGEVYRAEHQRVGHEVAIKVLTHPQYASDSAKFVEEARIQSQLRHPHIAAFYGYLEAHGQCCIVMEYVAGQTLSDRIRLQGKLPVTEALTIFCAVVEAIAFMHDHHIIHRDIKPGNIRLGAQVKLLDFGIAKAPTTPQFTVTGRVMGTLQYLPPERLRGEAADERSDIWALGVLLYEMLTGQLPFAVNSIAELCAQTSRGSFLSPSILNPEVPRDVEALINRCLKKNPTDRYASAQVLFTDARRAQTATNNNSAVNEPLWSRLLNRFSLPQMARPVWLLAVLLLALGLYLLWPNHPSGPVGRVKIETQDGAALVYCNDRKMGTTPVEFEAVIGEQVIIRLERAGFRNKQFPVQVNSTGNHHAYTLEKIAAQ